MLSEVNSEPVKKPRNPCSIIKEKILNKTDRDKGEPLSYFNKITIEFIKKPSNPCQRNNSRAKNESIIQSFNNS